MNALGTAAKAAPAAALTLPLINGVRHIQRDKMHTCWRGASVATVVVVMAPALSGGALPVACGVAAASAAGFTIRRR